MTKKNLSKEKQLNTMSNSHQSTLKLMTLLLMNLLWPLQLKQKSQLD
jgi:hypothetical protein